MEGTTGAERACVNGHPAADADVFCGTCGAPLARASTPLGWEPPTAWQTLPSPSPTSWLHRHGRMVGAVAAVVAVVGAATGILVAHAVSSSTKTSSYPLVVNAATPTTVHLTARQRNFVACVRVMDSWADWLSKDEEGRADYFASSVGVESPIFQPVESIVSQFVANSYQVGYESANATGNRAILNYCLDAIKDGSTVDYAAILLAPGGYVAGTTGTTGTGISGTTGDTGTTGTGVTGDSGTGTTGTTGSGTTGTTGTGTTGTTGSGTTGTGTTGTTGSGTTGTGTTGTGTTGTGTTGTGTSGGSTGVSGGGGSTGGVSGNS